MSTIEMDGPVLDAVFQASDTFVGVLDTDGILLRANRAALDFIQVDEGNITGIPFPETPWWEHSAEFQTRLRDGITRAANGEAITFQATHIAPDSTVRYIDFTLTPVRNDDGTVGYLLAQGRDITDRIHTEAIYEVIWQNAQDGMRMTNSEGIITRVNPAYCELVEKPRDELIGKPLTVVFRNHDDRMQKYREQFRGRTISSHRREELTLYNGKSLCVEETNTFIHPPGEDEQVLGIFRDIGHVKQAEEEYKEMIDGMNDTAFVIGFNGGFLEVNETAVRELGYSREELLTMGPADIDPNLPPEEIRSLIEGMQSDERQVFETQHQTKSGGIMDVEISSSKVTYQGETAILSVARDITERKRMEQELIRTQKLESLGQVAGGIAHDFNNVLNTINTALQMIEMKAEQKESLRKYLEMAQTSITQGQTITDRLVTFTRKESAGPTSVELGHFLHEMQEFVTHVLPKHIAVDSEIQDDESSVLANPAEIRQVLMNLCINAKQAMPDGGEITFGCRPPTGEERATYMSDEGQSSFWCITVTDTGPGIDPEIQDRLFEPFFTTKRDPASTGLGLSIAHTIIQAHNGWINVESTPGEGTTFIIGLPAGDTDTVETDSADGITEAGNHEQHHVNSRILIVEDEEVSRELLAEYLAEAGWEVLAAGDGEQAVEKYEEWADEIGVVITDLGLPRKSGQEVLQELLVVNPEVKAIAVTGYVEAQSPKELLDMGFISVLAKPYKMREVAKHVRKLVGE